MFARYLRSGIGLCCALFCLTLASAQAEAQGPQGVARGRLLVRFRSEATMEQVRGLLASARTNSLGQIQGTGVHVLQLPEQANEFAMANAFRQQDAVLFAEVDAACPPDMTVNDPLFTSQWHLLKIGAPLAWDTTFGSSNVIIAILDTGCDPTHPDLSARYVAGWNTFSNNSDTRDVYGHGTPVAGTAAASGNNGFGVASVAWNCRIMPMRISDTTGYGYYSTVASALTWAADHGARVANISYDMTASSTVTSAAQYFQSKGGVVTMSAGNASTFVSAADNPYILTISATDSNDLLPTWSNRGNFIDLAAPGVGIYSTDNGGGYRSHSGTSFSAPVVAGVAGLVISAKPGLTATQIQNVLKQSADDRGTVGWDTSYGWGRINATRAVLTALATTVTNPPPPPDTTAPSVRITSPLGGTTFNRDLTVTAAASDNVAVSRVEVWVNGTLQRTLNSAPYSVRLNTRSWARGSYTLQCKAVDTAGNAALSASVTVTK